MHSVLRQGALAQARLVRAGELSSAELVEAHIEQIQRVNPVLNALVVQRFDAARSEARAADAARQRGELLGPLHGVPCTVKETFALAGCPNTAGSVYRRDVRPTADATTVTRTRTAGAIPLGVSNVPEMAMWIESYNRVYGRTTNPYDQGRTCGGSSGGEAALIGAAASPFGIGTDIGGSIRLPAFFCGIFGHKPTARLVPLAGHYPPCFGAINAYCVAGPLSRTAKDLMPLLRVVAGPDGSPEVASLPLGEPDEVTFRGRRVWLCDQLGGLPSRPTTALREAVTRAGRALEERGAIVEPFGSRRLARALQIYSGMLAAVEGPTFHELIGDGAPPPLGRELVRWALRRSRHTLPALLMALTEKAAKASDKQLAAHQAEGRALRAELDALFSDGSVLLLPTYPRPAPRHNVPLAFPMDWLYTAIFNVMELPATAVPTGLSPRGIPLGVQVVGGHGQDHVTIATALALEESLGGWQPPLGLVS
ncbi:MAG: amidase [Deltaproteobacteria bacterium]|nr:amidase [Deltaproteobacteria bacterium]